MEKLCRLQENGEAINVLLWNKCGSILD